jgi:tRNA(Arg) A34 adenosine deaminase TadA
MFWAMLAPVSGTNPSDRALELTLPEWFGSMGLFDRRYPGVEQRLELVIELSRRNVRERTGGPFGAAVFELESGILVGAGVSRVERLNCSVAHAEVMAIAFAQKRLGRFDLGARDAPAHELVSSAQPCLMCAGASLWSGATRLAYAARKHDVESLVGFDEGPVPPDWIEAFRARGIEVVEAPERWRSEACEVLRLYRAQDGLVYNGRQAAPSRA